MRHSSSVTTNWIILLQVSIVALVFLQFHSSEAFVTNQNSSLVVGQSFFTTMANTPVNSSSLNKPIGIAFDSAGNLWVADSNNNRILNYSSSSFGINHPNATTVLGQSSFTAGGSSTTATTLRAVSALTFDSSGNLWVSDEDNSRILEYTTPFTTGKTASLVLGQSSFTTSGTGTSTTTVNTPDALAFDSSGNLWVSDQGNNRILKYTTPFTTGQAASLILGHSSFTQASSGTNTTALNNPISVIFDSSGNLWVTDQNNNRILRYSSPFVNNMAANLVIGQTSFTTGTAGTSTSMLNNPANIAFDSSGNLWVADDNNNRILEYKYPFSNGMSASLVLGQANFTSNGINNGFSNPSASSLNDVNGITFDKSGNLWVADSGNNRILRHIQASQNQVLVDNSVTTITVNSATPQLIVANANTNLSTIKIPSTVTDTTINYSNILVKKPAGNSVTLNNALGIKANATAGNFQITFPKNIIINGPSSWSGTVNVATVSSVSSLPQGSISAINIQVGLSSTKLTLSKAAELVFTGDAGKKVGFTYGGSFTEITHVCSADDATGIPSGVEECKIDVGADLHVWTLHFTTFSVYISSSSSSSSISSGGNLIVGVGPLQESIGGTCNTSAFGDRQSLQVYDIKYDKCGTHQINITAASKCGAMSIQVDVLHGSTMIATLSQNQPFKDMLLFTAPIDPDVKSFIVTAKNIQNTIITDIDSNQCTGTVDRNYTMIEGGMLGNALSSPTTSHAIQIPSWIKSTAKWWSQGSVTDSDFVNGMQYLIHDEIIKIPATTPVSHSNQIPTWIRNDAALWSNGQISDDEFVKGMEYLIQVGIIKV